MPKAATRSAGWTTVAFGDVVRLSTERSSDPEADGFERFVGLDHIEPGELRIRRWGDVADGTTFTSVFRRGQVLFGKRRAYQRKVAVADFSGVCSGDIYVLESKGKDLLPEFLPFICQTDAFFEHAVATSAGSLSPRTNWTSLASFKFSLPPIDEQRRISNGLMAAANFVSSVRSLVDNAARTVRSLAEHVFSVVLQSSANGGTTLGEVFEHVVDRGYKNLPILSVTINGSVVRRESLERHVLDETGDEKYLRVKKGDIAYNTMRLWQGAVGIAGEEGLVSPAYTVLRVRTASVPVSLLWEMLRSPALKRRYREFVTGVASDRWRLYYRDLSRVRVRFPTDYELAAATKVLSQARTVEEAAATRLQHSCSLLEALRKQSIGS